MARSFTTGALQLISGSALMARWLVTFTMDGPSIYRFCDDWQDLSDGTNTYIGASALASAANIISSGPFAAESVQLVIDGVRLQQSGFTDPASFFRTILAQNLPQRRVDISMGFAAVGSTSISLVVPVYAGKINFVRIEEDQVELSSANDSGGVQSPTKLIIQLDSLAMRYQWVNNRVRSHQDQLEIDSSDYFFQFVADTIAQDRNLYWGKASPNVVTSRNNGGTQIGYGGGSLNLPIRALE